MNFVEIKINKWNVSHLLLDSLYVVSNIEKLDDVLSGIIPKIFYHYKIVDTENTFIVVPKEFENKVQEIVDKIIVTSINLSCLSSEELGLT